MTFYVVNIAHDLCDYNQHHAFATEWDAIDFLTSIRKEVYIDAHPQSYGVSEVYKDEPLDFYFNDRHGENSVRFYITEHTL